MSSMAPLYFSVLGSVTREKRRQADIQNALAMQEREQARKEYETTSSFIARTANAEIEKEKLALRQAANDAENSGFMASLTGDEDMQAEVYQTPEQRAAHARGMLKGAEKRKQQDAALAMERAKFGLEGDKFGLAVEKEMGNQAYKQDYLDYLYAGLESRENTARANRGAVRDHTKKWNDDAIRSTYMRAFSDSLRAATALGPGGLSMNPAQQKPHFDRAKQMLRTGLQLTAQNHPEWGMTPDQIEAQVEARFQSELAKLGEAAPEATGDAGSVEEPGLLQSLFGGGAVPVDPASDEAIIDQTVLKNLQ